MRERVSAGLLLYRYRNGRREYLLAHPGGPYFKGKDDGCWSIPKGEIEDWEKQEPLATAIREVMEEVGLQVNPKAHFIELGSIRQKGGKVVHAWGVEMDCEVPNPLPSSTFSMEWPPHSKHVVKFPEIDRAEFFPLEIALQKIKDRQRPFLERLEKALEGAKNPKASVGSKR
jgi:predicted NUDIX family NTP pyrophosphohydrolase